MGFNVNNTKRTKKNKTYVFLGKKNPFPLAPQIYPPTHRRRNGLSPHRSMPQANDREIEIEIDMPEPPGGAQPPQMRDDFEFRDPYATPSTNNKLPPLSRTCPSHFSLNRPLSNIQFLLGVGDCFKSLARVLCPIILPPLWLQSEMIIIIVNNHKEL